MPRLTAGTRGAVAAAGFGLTFNGGTNKVTVVSKPAQDNLTAISLAMWLYRTGNGGGNFGIPITKGSSGNGYFRIFYNNNTANTMGFSQPFSVASNQWRTPNTFTSSAWHHLIVTFPDLTDINALPTFYVNGAAAAATSFSTASGTKTADDTSLIMGNRDDNARGWAGRLDDIRMYNVVLTVDEARAIYQKHDVSRGLVGLWTYDENGGLVAHDRSGQRAHGAISGATFVAGTVDRYRSQALNRTAA